MRAKIVYPDIVRIDLQNVARYVSQGGDALALEWLTYIQQRIEMLADHPLIGPAYNQTYRKLQARSFWILYRIDNETDPKRVTLVRIIHHKQDIQATISVGNG